MNNDPIINADAVGAIIEIARQMAQEFQLNEERYENTPMEDLLIDMVISFQKLHDGDEGYNDLKGKYERVQFLRKV